MIADWINDWSRSVAAKLAEADLPGATLALGNMIRYSETTLELQDAHALFLGAMPYLLGRDVKDISVAITPLRNAAIRAGPNDIARANLID
ncbi:hypothetical protein [Metarhizobium album]|uniref:hypothetical protein n=1 Tax=Metarhizobium album TaxID=2182425 RepID=UPI000FFEEE19|nr:hypothetical protein [Rhizobium album]